MTTRTNVPGPSLFLAALLGLFLMNSGVSAGELVLRAEPVDAAAGASVEVPLAVSGTAGMEGLQFVLSYDPAQLEHTAVKPGPLAGAGVVDVKVRRPGEIRVAMYPEKTLQKDGILLLVHFDVLGAAGSSAAVELTEARAWDFQAGYPLEMLVVAESGSIAVVPATAIPTAAWWGGGLVLAILAGAAIRRRLRG
jgi:hypothetical protein